MHREVPVFCFAATSKQERVEAMTFELSCGMTPAEIEAEAAEAERETAACEAKRVADHEAWIASLPTKHMRYFHRHKVRRICESAMTRADNLGALPKRLTKAHHQQINELYEAAEALHKATGIPHEVDHIVQLVGKNRAGEHVICGLHVPWNLRAIPKSLNRKRGDRFYIAACERTDPYGDDYVAYGCEAKYGDDVPF